MPRHSRIDAAGALHHIVARGIGQRNMFNIVCCTNEVATLLSALEGIKRVFPKKDFRTALESEGYRIKNSSKHVNQLRIFAETLEV